MSTVGSRILASLGLAIAAGLACMQKLALHKFGSLDSESLDWLGVRRGRSRCGGAKHAAAALPRGRRSGCLPPSVLATSLFSSQSLFLRQEWRLRVFFLPPALLIFCCFACFSRSYVRARCAPPCCSQFAPPAASAPGTAAFSRCALVYAPPCNWCCSSPLLHAVDIAWRRAFSSLPGCVDASWTLVAASTYVSYQPARAVPATPLRVAGPPCARLLWLMAQQASAAARCGPSVARQPFIGPARGAGANAYARA